MELTVDKDACVGGCCTFISRCVPFIIEYGRHEGEIKEAQPGEFVTLGEYFIHFKKPTSISAVSALSKKADWISPATHKCITAPKVNGNRQNPRCFYGHFRIPPRPLFQAQRQQMSQRGPE